MSKKKWQDGFAREVGEKFDRKYVNKKQNFDEIAKQLLERIPEYKLIWEEYTTERFIYEFV